MERKFNVGDKCYLECTVKKVETEERADGFSIWYRIILPDGDVCILNGRYEDAMLPKSDTISDVEIYDELTHLHKGLSILSDIKDGEVILKELKSDLLDCLGHVEKLLNWLD